MIVCGLLRVVPFPAAQAQTSTPQQTPQQYVAELQGNPNDDALREKIIKLAREMNPPPAVSDAARKYMDRGIAAMEDAKGIDDFKAASDEFTKATNLAPWLGDAYRNLAIAQDKAGQYDAALKNLRLYLLTAPALPDEDWARSLMNKVEYRREKAARESSPETIAVKQQTEYEAWLKKLDGARFVRRVTTDRDSGMWWAEIHGDTIAYGIYMTWSKFSPEQVGKNIQWGAGRIVGKNFQGLRTGVDQSAFTGRISDDGDTLYLTDRGWNALVENTYRRER